MIKKVLDNNDNKEINEREIEILKEHFPACFKPDGSFDIERFKSQVKKKVDVIHEGYELNFLGKSYAKLLSSLDTTTIIQPNLEHNEKPENKNSENVYISGDNLDGLKHLLSSYAKKVKCIYIDPNYNTGTDGFVYSDKFNFTVQELEEKLSISEAQAQRILDLTERGSASHSAWLMFMYPRLLLARDMLADDGVIFVSIDDNEQANLKLLCDDVFSEENFIAQIIVQSNKRGQTYKQLAKTHEYLLVYNRNADVILNELNKEQGSFDFVDNISEFSIRELRNRNPKYGRFNRPNLYYPIYVNTSVADNDGFHPASLVKNDLYIVEVWPVNSEGKESCWRWGKPKFSMNVSENTLESNIVAKLKTSGKYGVYEKYRKTTFKAKTIWFNEFFGDDLLGEQGDVWDETGVITEQGSIELGELGLGEMFDFPKPTYLLEKVLTIGAAHDSVVLDFFSGSATTAHAVMKLNSYDSGNRKYIIIQLPEDLERKYELVSASDKTKIKKVIDFLSTLNRPRTLDQIGIERIIRAARKIKEDNPDADIDYGFKHFTLCEPQGRTLDKLMEFEPDVINEANNSILDEFGRPAVLTTWLVNDGYGFSVEVAPIDLGGYIAYHYDKHLYLIDADLSADHVVRLFEKYDSEGGFNPENIVLFGYSFNKWSVTEMLTQNMRLLNDGEKNLKINIDIRY